MRLRRIRMEAGDFTYGQRLAIADIFADESRRDYAKMRDAFRELYGWPCRLLPPRMRVRWLDSMMDGIAYWTRVEQATLKYEPSDEEQRAGIDEYSRAVGHMANIKAIAKDYGIDPDTALQWKWSKVYGILFTDLEAYRYEQRLQRVYNKRYERQ